MELVVGHGMLAVAIVVHHPDLLVPGSVGRRNKVDV